MAPDTKKSKLESSPLHEGDGRQCTDVIFLILFLAFWIGMLVVAAFAVMKGNPDRLLYGFDMEGNICGVDNTIRNSSMQDMREKPFLYYPTFKDLWVQICVANCPSETIVIPTHKDDVVCLYSVAEEDLSNPAEVLFQVTVGRCWSKYRSTDVFHRCVPSFTKDEAPTNTTAEEQDSIINMSKVKDLSSKFFGDLNRCKFIILLCCGLAVFMGFFWLLLLRLFASFIVWSTIFGVLAANSWIAYKCWRYYQDEKDWYDTIPPNQRMESDDDDMVAMEILFYIFMSITIILFLIILVLRNKIRLSIQIIKEASKAMQDMPFLVFFPLVIFAILIIIIIYWLGVSLFLGTAGQPVYDKRTGEFGGYEADDTLRYMQIYHFFGLLWTTEFWLAVGQCIVAAAVSTWYFTVNKQDDLPRFPVAHAFWLVLRYHTGSLALGSLIIAIVQFMRACLNYFEKSLKQHLDIDFVNYIYKCLQCCFKCLERFLKFINKNAYIQMAIYGDNFCTSARRAFELITRNIVKMGAVNVISEFLLFLGRVFVAVSCGLACFYMIQFDNGILTGGEPINYKSIVVAIVMLLTYYLGTAFMEIYDMAIDTILLCFCEDCERNDGSNAHPYFMSEELKEFVNESEKVALQRKMDAKRRTAKVQPV